MSGNCWVLCADLGGILEANRSGAEGRRVKVVLDFLFFLLLSFSILIFAVGEMLDFFWIVRWRKFRVSFELVHVHTQVWLGRGCCQAVPYAFHPVKADGFSAHNALLKYYAVVGSLEFPLRVGFKDTQWDIRFKGILITTWEIELCGIQLFSTLVLIYSMLQEVRCLSRQTAGICLQSSDHNDSNDRDQSFIRIFICGVI